MAILRLLYEYIHEYLLFIMKPCSVSMMIQEVHKKAIAKQDLCKIEQAKYLCDNKLHQESDNMYHV